MTTTPLGGSSSSGTTTAALPKGYNLNPADFIKMMVTQLQNQDPLQPASNQELLSQVSQIGQLQATTQLQSVLQGLALQGQIGSASGLIGKMVQGKDANQNPISGVVNSVKVSSDGVSLELDNGQSLPLAQVSGISPGPLKAAA